MATASSMSSGEAGRMVIGMSGARCAPGRATALFTGVALLTCAPPASSLVTAGGAAMPGRGGQAASRYGVPPDRHTRLEHLAAAPAAPPGRRDTAAPFCYGSRSVPAP